jgi:hypothetical protein
MGETPTAPKAVDGTHVSRNYVVFHANSRLRTVFLNCSYEIMPQGALAAPIRLNSTCGQAPNQLLLVNGEHTV